MNVEQVCKKIAETFGCPCDYSPCDEIMAENETCKVDCMTIEDWECWKRYFEFTLAEVEE